MSDLTDSDVSNAGEPGRDSWPRRVQLSDLPHEIKGLIVQHCHGADHNIDGMLQSLVKRGGLPLDSDCSLDDLRKSYRRTVAVLYEVSKEWRDLCAPYKFEHLSTEKVADDFFQLVIAPTHGRHFVSVECDATTSTRIVELIKALPFLPNLHTFDLSSGLLTGLDDLDGPLRRVAEEKLILAIEHGARRLILGSLPVDNVFRFTARAANVTNLSLVLTSSLVLDKLWNIISPMKELAKLVLLFPDISPTEPLQLAALLDTRVEGPPALKSLLVCGYMHLDSLPDFIAVLASTLCVLIISYADMPLHAEMAQPLMPACPFPQLRALHLDVPEVLLQTTLNALLGSPQLPSLRLLSAVWQGTSLSATNMTSFDRLLANRPDTHARLIPLRDGHPLSLLDAFGPRAEEGSRMTVEHAPPKHPLLATTNTDALAELLQDDDTAHEQRQNTLDAIDHLLEYATERRKRIAVTEDWVEAARFVKDLGRLDLERMIHRL